MEILVLAVMAVAWFYSEELISFLQLDRAQRMANRKLDRLENEQVIEDVNYYGSSKEMPSDELVKKAIENKARVAKFRSI